MTVSGAGSGSAQTDEEGYYSITGLATGVYSVTASATDYHSAVTEDVSVTSGTVTVDVLLDEAIVPEIFEIAEFGDAVVPFVIDPWLNGDWAYIGFRAQDSHQVYNALVTATLEVKSGQTTVATLAADEPCATGIEYWTVWDGTDDYGNLVDIGVYEVLLTVRDSCGNESVGSSMVGVWFW